jgi:hypothetical protein
MYWLEQLIYGYLTFFFVGFAIRNKLLKYKFKNVKSKRYINQIFRSRKII